VFVTGEDHPGQDKVVILSHSLWQKNSAAIECGRPQMALAARIGKLSASCPRNFSFLAKNSAVGAGAFDHGMLAIIGVEDHALIGRLHAGMTIAQAHTELRSALHNFAQCFRGKMPGCFVGRRRRDFFAAANYRRRANKTVRSTRRDLPGAADCLPNWRIFFWREESLASRNGRQTALGAIVAEFIGNCLPKAPCLAFAAGRSGNSVGGQRPEVLKLILPADTPRLPDINIDWRSWRSPPRFGAPYRRDFRPCTAVFAGKVDLTESAEKRRTAFRHAPGSSHRLRGARSFLAIALFNFHCGVRSVIGAGLLVKKFVGNCA